MVFKLGPFWCGNPASTYTHAIQQIHTEIGFYNKYGSEGLCQKTNATASPKVAFTETNTSFVYPTP